MEYSYIPILLCHFVPTRHFVELVLRQILSYLQLLEVLVLQQVRPVVEVVGGLVHFVLGSKVRGALRGLVC